MISVGTIAVGTLHLLGKKANIDFPTSNRSQPSHEVFISLRYGGLLDDRWRVLFPMTINGSYWQQVVVPIIRTVSYPELLDTSTSYKEVADYLTQLLIEKSQETGWFPKSEIVTEEPVLENNVPVIQQFEDPIVYSRYD